MAMANVNFRSISSYIPLHIELLHPPTRFGCRLPWHVNLIDNSSSYPPSYSMIIEDLFGSCWFLNQRLQMRKAWTVKVAWIESRTICSLNNWAIHRERDWLCDNDLSRWCYHHYGQCDFRMVFQEIAAGEELRAQLNSRVMHLACSPEVILWLSSSCLLCVKSSGLTKHQLILAVHMESSYMEPTPPPGWLTDTVRVAVEWI
jgi:hypothetical protein